MGTRPTGNNMCHRAMPWGKIPLMMCFRCRSGCSRLTGQAQFGIRLFGELRHPRTLLVLPCVVANFCWAQKIRNRPPGQRGCSRFGGESVCGAGGTGREAEASTEEARRGSNQRLPQTPHRRGHHRAHQKCSNRGAEGSRTDVSRNQSMV